METLQHIYTPKRFLLRTTHYALRITHQDYGHLLGHVETQLKLLTRDKPVHVNSKFHRCCQSKTKVPTGQEKIRSAGYSQKPFRIHRIYLERHSGFKLHHSALCVTGGSRNSYNLVTVISVSSKFLTARFPATSTAAAVTGPSLEVELGLPNSV